MSSVQAGGGSVPRWRQIRARHSKPHALASPRPGKQENKPTGYTPPKLKPRSQFGKFEGNQTISRDLFLIIILCFVLACFMVSFARPMIIGLLLGIKRPS